MNNEEQTKTYYAGFWMRLGAYIVDFVIVVLAVYTTYLVSGLIYFAATGQLGSDEPAPTAVAMVALILCLAVAIGYPICFWRWRGQTPGKMVLRIRVVRSDGSSLTWGAAIARFLGYIVAWITCGVLFLWVAFDRHKRGVHDRIADTCVVKTPRRSAAASEVAYEKK